MCEPAVARYAWNGLTATAEPANAGFFPLDERWQTVSVERTQWESAHYAPQQRQSIGVDGGMANVREEGWKEFKVGAIGRLLPPDQLGVGENTRSHTLHYTAVIGGVEALASAL